jgi:T-complex protein 10 C-terminus
MDGKRERLFRDGRRMVVFVNGTIKEEYPSGLSIVRFTNGDIKKAYTNGAHQLLVFLKPHLHVAVH